MSSLQQQIARYARVQLAMAVIAIVAVASIYFAAIRPAQLRRKAMLASIQTEQELLQAEQRRVALLPQMQVQVNDLRNRLSHFDKKLPSKPDMDQFMRDVTRVSEQSSLKNMTVTPGSPKRSDLFSEMPIVLNFTGGFPSVFDFLHQTEQMQRLLRVRSLQIKASDVQSGTVEVNLSMSIYFADQ